MHGALTSDRGGMVLILLSWSAIDFLHRRLNLLATQLTDVQPFGRVLP